MSIDTEHSYHQLLSYLCKTETEVSCLDKTYTSMKTAQRTYLFAEQPQREKHKNKFVLLSGIYDLVCDSILINNCE
jgi:hypothetical protein